MKTLPQASDALGYLADMLKGHRVAMLTLMDREHGLTSRPMTALEMAADGALWFIGSRRIMGPLLAGGAAANLAFTRHNVSDYISIAGHAELVEDPARKRALWSVAARPWFSGPGDPDLTLIRLVPEQADLWDGPDSTATRVLAMAASVLTGRAIGLGNRKDLRTGLLPGRG